jgi:hypothetical protein
MTTYGAGDERGAAAPPESNTRAQEIAKPVLRKVPAELLSPMGWLSGLLHVPVHQTLTEFLSLAPRLVKLTRVRIPHEQEVRPFVAIKRDAISLVAPSLDEGVESPGDRAYSALREVALLLPAGVLRGSLAVLLNMRLSDHLQQHGPLLTLRHSLLTPYGETAKSPGARAFGTVIANLDSVLGVSEEV